MKDSSVNPRDYRYSPLTRLGRNLLRKVNKAVKEFGLFTNDDRMCVAVSGGKDSLSLLWLMLEHKRFYAGKFPLEAVHVVSDFAPDAIHVRDYIDRLLKEAGVPCTFIEISVTTDEHGKPATPSCFHCSWKRREAIFRHCAQNGFNRLALAHHADDVAETTLMNLLYHGSLETMLPRRSFFDGKFDLIRPLFYIREREMVRYAKMAGFETVGCTCPNAKTSKRKMAKQLVQYLSSESKMVHANFWRAARIWHDAVGDLPCHKKPKKDKEPPDTDM